MAKKGDYRENVIDFLHKALHELHQAAMYAQGVDHTEVRRLVTTTENLKERISKDLSEDLVQRRADAKRAAAMMKMRQETALANRAKAQKK
jgi:hypothetical protein